MLPKDVPPRGRVVVTAPGFDPDGELTGRRLTRAGWTVDNVGPDGHRSPREVAKLLASADAAILSSDPVTTEVLSAATRLQVIARLGVGFDNIDLQSATKGGVVVTTTPGVNDETCADHALAMLLAAMRRIPEHDASVRAGEWNRGGPLTPWDLHGKRIGVIGYGRIGRCVVTRLRGFSSPIRVLDPFAAVQPELVCASLDDLLDWADVLTLHVPLTPTTRNLIGARELARLRRGAVIVNTSRGGLVDETALLAALLSGHVRAAALDVFEDEPPLHHRWQKVPNVVLSPHVGGLSVESIEAMGRQCVDQIISVFEGRRPDGVVNREVYNRRASALGGAET